MEKLQMKIRPEITIVPIKAIKNEGAEENFSNSEDGDSDDSDDWSGSMTVDAPALEPLVKIEEADGSIQGLPQTDSRTVRNEQECVIQQQKQQLPKLPPSTEEFQTTEEALQEAELRDRLEWKALANGNVCTECGREFTALGRLRQHILTHLAKPVAGKIAEGISAMPATRSKLGKHCTLPPLRARRRHTCTLCGKMFIREAHLKRHILVHTGERPHQCEVCHKCFTAADDLKVHLRVHTGERPHQCCTCNKAFTTAGNLKVHLRVHSGERPYGCASCGKCFTRAAALKKHQRLHTGSAISF